MDSNTSFSQNIDSIFTELHDFVKTESVIGNPLTVGDKTLVPIVSVSLGYGSAPGGKNAKNNPGSSDPSLGLGAKVATNAVVVIDKDNVSMLPVNGKANMDQLLDKIPNMVNSLKGTTTQQNMTNNQQQPAQQNAQAGTQSNMQQNTQKPSK